jgi:hypothetical protein
LDAVTARVGMTPRASSLTLDKAAERRVEFGGGRNPVVNDGIGSSLRPEL